MGDLRKLVGPLRNLRVLSVGTRGKDKTVLACNVDVAELDILVDSLPSGSITSPRIGSLGSLDRMPFRQLGISRGFVPVGLAKLQSLILRMEAAFHTPADAHQFGTALGGLHHLELLDGQGAALPPPREQFLTQLRRVNSYPFSGDAASTSARFLVRMPQLRHLHLWQVLDFTLWEDDVGYVASLTDLRDLCLVWAGNRAVLTADAQVRPLFALRYLEWVTLRGARPGAREGGREGRRHLAGHSCGISGGHAWHPTPDWPPPQ
eukprot:jgi/Botrbrau1/9851/Bobra.0313s0020.1